MPQAPIRETAEIIPFPKRPRTGKVQLGETTREHADRLGITLCDYGSGWYHDAALQEAQAQADLPKPRRH